MLIVLEVAVVVLSFTIMANGSDSSGLGFLILLVGIPLPFISAAKQMMMINNAENLRRIAINTEKTVDLLSKRR